jgi:murein L,D-transpeptidase YafK
MTGSIRVRRSLAGILVGLAVLAVASCSGYDGASLPKHLRPLDSKTRALVERNDMEQTAPIFIRIFKEEAVLEVWKLQRTTGRYAFLKSYEICAWSGVLGPKLREGDRQAPEGFYTIRPAQMNPDSNYYLAFNLGYPNAFDQALGRTGSELMVHGACSSAGCYSMTDENIEEIYTLGRLAFQGGQREFQVQAFPFRMTPENLARHRNDPNIAFWTMLKEGYDHFEVLRVPPRVEVCDRRYVFNAMPDGNAQFRPAAACPPMSMPEAVRVAVAEKAEQDRAQMLRIAARMDRQESTSGVDALMLAFAQPATVDLAGPMSVIPAGAVAVPPPAEPVMTASVAPATPPPVPAAAPASPPVVVSPAPIPAETPRVPTPAPRPVAVAAALAAPPVAPSAPASAAVPPAAAAATPTALPAATGIDAFMPATGLGVVDAGVTGTPPPVTPVTPTTQPEAVSLEERMLAGTAASAEPAAVSAPGGGPTWGTMLWGLLGR